MAKGVTFKVDTSEFTRTLREYRKYSKRTLPVIVNTKAMFIARHAILETPKADKAKIERELGEFVSVNGSKKKQLLLAIGKKHDAPLAALIINARRGREGRPGLYGAKMAAAVRVFVAARIRSISFLKSGWLPAIKTLLPFSDRRGGPRQEKGVKQIGQPKGYGKPAREGWNVVAEIANTASDNKNNRGALWKYGGPALQRAFNAEAASMREYIEKKMREAAKQSGIKTN